MNTPLAQWVNDCAALTKPDHIHWCDGSETEYQAVITRMLNDGTLISLNPQLYPGCYLHRSNPNDVARVENLTFICSNNEQDAGPTNHWMSPNDAESRVKPMFDGCMSGRTMYVVPYVMGPIGSPHSRVGVEITDSPYVVANMRIMTRMGTAALDLLGSSNDFVPGLHSTGDLNPSRRYILHFPERRSIWSFGSAYGGNALLGKKCFALRIAGVQARDEGWMAEHMLILELSDPSGDVYYFAAAFPSACGKTNLAMLVSPLEEAGYRVRTVGDDIAWMRIGEDGRLWAVNPEAGFFGVATGTRHQTNPNALIAAHSNTIYTNVAVTQDGRPWWEGNGEEPPANLTDWHGNPWDGKSNAAHPNSRFTAPARQCPSMSPRWEDPAGVPISGIIFGGRRDTTIPLVAQAFDWNHGVFMGATMCSQTTAAAEGATNVLRHDPMAMLPFCGYHMGDYFRHWLDMGTRLANPPAIFHVNWFRKGATGKYLWQGYGQNVRALIWMMERVQGKVGAEETLFGLVPRIGDLNLDGLDLAKSDLQELLSVCPAELASDVEAHRKFFEKIGDRCPKYLIDRLEALGQSTHGIEMSV